MGNRGSKSKLVKRTTNFVKEQRVYGNWWIKTIHLRCTLMGFERNYPIKILSKQLNTKQFSTLNPKLDLNPWFVTGFFDGESTFHISIVRSEQSKLGWQIRGKFKIGLHQRDKALLLQIQEYFGGIGRINIDQKNKKAMFVVSKFNDLNNIIIPHFLNYRLLTQKAADFLLFKRVIELMNKKSSSN